MLMVTLASEALLFMHMKEEIDATLKKYGTDNPLPPAQLITIANKPDAGNMYFVQRAFEGSFEVCPRSTTTTS